MIRTNRRRKFGYVGVFLRLNMATHALVYTDMRTGQLRPKIFNSSMNNNSETLFFCLARLALEDLL